MSFFTLLLWLVSTAGAWWAYTNEDYYFAGMLLFQVLISVLGDIADAIKDNKK